MGYFFGAGITNGSMVSGSSNGIVCGALDPVVYTTTLPNTDGADAADLTGQPNFNAENIEAATGQFWGVMALTLNENGYAWDFESALKDPAQTTGPFSFSDKGGGTCHGPANR